MSQNPADEPFIESTTTTTVKPLTPKKSRTKKPNYNLIHKDTLPVTLYQAPPLIPHNPLSILHHIYLYFFPPIVSHTPSYTAVFSPETSSVNVTDAQAILDLWRRGFWGKGSLSRSEPTWLQRELRRLGYEDVSETSEEVTRRRREERKEFKKERAQKEKEELERILREEAEKKKISGNDSGVSSEIKTEFETSKVMAEGIHSGNGLPTPPLSITEATELLAPESSSIIAVQTCEDSGAPPDMVALPSPSKGVRFADNPIAEIVILEERPSASSVQDEEHLQLTLHEAFFLVFALGVLTVSDPSTKQQILTPDLLTLFRKHSASPPIPATVALSFTTDDRFLIDYAVYHHFRSLGWVVKHGIKFSVDFLLYSRGPVFTHAEYGVVVVPNYSTWDNSREETKRREWWWLHEIMRVSSQVKKTVVLCYVDVPTVEDVKGWEEKSGMGLKGLLAKYKIREVGLSRWIPNRNRD